MSADTFNLDENLSPIILLKPMEVAMILDISRSLAYRLLQTGAIPSIRFGTTVRVRAVDLYEFIQRSWSGWKQE